MPTTDQKADLLFKKYLGVGSVGTSSAFYNESKLGRPAVYPNQLWASWGDIPTSASYLAGITTKSIDLTLQSIPGVSNQYAFYHADLMDAIPFNFDPSGSYVPTLKKSDNSTIPFGTNDWVIDTEAGLVTFYAGLPSGVSSGTPPKITFWKYVGAKGVSTTASFVDGGTF
jgi:hypothetical protein